jgi:hypothetical protein
MDRMLGQSRDLQPVLLGGRLLGNSCARKVLSVVSGVRRLGADGERDDADLRRIADTTTCTKPPYFGRTIALWGLYSAFIVSRPRWKGPANRSITAQWYRRLRCVAIVLTKYTVVLGTAAIAALYKWVCRKLAPKEDIGRPASALAAQGPLPRVDLARENTSDINE